MNTQRYIAAPGLVALALTLLALAACPEAHASLATDVAATCDRLQADTSTAGQLRAAMLTQLLSCNRVDKVYADDSVLTDPKARDKHFLRRKPNMRGEMFVYFDVLYSLTDLERLVYAQRFVEEKRDRKRFARDFGRAALFHALHTSVDRGRLSKEVAAASWLAGRTGEVFLAIYDAQKTVAADWAAFHATVASDPDLGAVLPTATETLARFLADAKKFGELGPRVSDAARAVFADRTLPIAQCDAPILDAFTKATSLPHDHPLVASMSAVLAACARARGDDELTAAYEGLAPAAATALGPYKGTLDALNRQLVARAAKANGKSAVRPSSALRYSYPGAWSVQRPERRQGQLHPTGGPVKIDTVTEVSYRGLPFRLVTGTGMQVTVPVMACEATQMGWQVGNGKIEPRMGTACRFTGKYRDENLSFAPVLVPAAFGTTLKRGQWARFQHLTGRHSPRPGHAKPAKGVKGAFFGAPALVADTLEAFTGDEAKMQLWRGDIAPLR